jgi:hypothetical protein
MSPVTSRHDSPGEHDERGTALTGLERRYARWTAVFYPAGYRRERGSELMDTYPSLAAPGRKRPSPADIADLAAGGLQRRTFREAGFPHPVGVLDDCDALSWPALSAPAQPEAESASSVTGSPLLTVP